jgi:molybdopterin-guanine dinucleotide biosynthesis protein A
MGRDKAQLDWHGRPLGEHQAATLVAAGVAPLFLSCRPEQSWTPRDFIRLEDRATGGGALTAFVDALTVTSASADVMLVLAIDLPLVQPAGLKALAVRAQAANISIVPWRENRFEPFAAAWHRSALPALRDALAQHQSLQQTCAGLREKKLLEALPVDGAEAANLINLNTPADAARLGCPV